MPKKQIATASAASNAAPSRNAKATTPRVKSAKHSKAAIVESTPAVPTTEIPQVVSPAIPQRAFPQEDPHTAISKIAYGYWAARDFQPGDANEDWLRAEAEYQTRLATV